MRYIISDLHLGHRNLSEYRNADGYISSEEQNNIIYENLCRIPKRATLFLLGDIAFSKEWLDKMKALQCTNKVIVVGNHCVQGDMKMRGIVDTYEQVYSLHKYKLHWMSHAPIHPQELRGKKCVHGHTHYHLMLNEARQPDIRYINVCVEYTGNSPISWEYATSEEYAQECNKKYQEYKQKGLLNDLR